MSNCYALRIHVDGMGAEGMSMFHQLLQSFESSGYVFALEVEATRNHIQGWVRTDIKQASLRMRIKRMFPGVVGNGKYSLKSVQDFEAYSDYCLKGTEKSLPDIVAQHCLDLTPEKIKEAHERYWERRRRSGGKSRGSIVDETYRWASSLEDVSRDDVVEHVCEEIVARNKPLMVHYVRGVVNSVMFKLGGCEKKGLMEYIKGGF